MGKNGCVDSAEGDSSGGNKTTTAVASNSQKQNDSNCNLASRKQWQKTMAASDGSKRWQQAMAASDGSKQRQQATAAQLFLRHPLQREVVTSVSATYQF